MQLFFLLLALLIGYAIGWRAAHVTVAMECERLGAFYVGKQIYQCSIKEDDSSN